MTKVLNDYLKGSKLKMFIEEKHCGHFEHDFFAGMVSAASDATIGS